jgi:RNA polymerase sigma-70 factor (ECF subfamily)
MYILHTDGINFAHWLRYDCSYNFILLKTLSPPTTDENLFLAYAQGDVAAFTTLYDRHKDWLYRLLLRQAGQRERANDIFQETWLTLIRNAPSYRPEAKFTTWLYRLARQRLIDAWRQQGCMQEVVCESVMEASGFDQEMLLTAQQMQSQNDAPLELESGDSPEMIYSRKQLANTLLHALERLPVAQREVFLLVEEAGMTVPEIAEALQEKQEAIKSRLRYARTKLQHMLNTTAQDWMSHV